VPARRRHSVTEASAAAVETIFWTSPANHGCVFGPPKSIASTLISSLWVNANTDPLISEHSASATASMSAMNP